MTTSPLQEKTITLNDKRFKLLEVGSGDPILFLTGLPLSGDSVRYVMQGLGANYHCLAFDFISHEGIIPLQEQALYLQLLVKFLQLDSITLVMHGISTMAGLSFVNSFASKCKALAFFDPFLGSVSEDIPLLWAEQLQAISQIDLSAEALATILYQLAPNTDLTASIAAYNGHYESLQAAYHELAKDHFGEVGQAVTALCKDVQKNTLPKLLMYGMPGFMLPLEHAVWAKMHWQNLQIRELEETFHMFTVEKADEVASALSAWMKSFAVAAEMVDET